MTFADLDATGHHGAPPAAGSRTPSMKAALDLLGALALLVACAPLMAAIALAVKLDSPGPVLFLQPRFGLGGRRIMVTKFRTMRRELGRPAERGGDPVTRIGRFLRRTSLDDLPQLWDVLGGRMSLVGPRPHPLSLEVDGRPIEELIPDYHLRHRVRPGITGLAQVRGNHGPVESEARARERLRHDMEYIRDRSIQLDLEILLRTLAVPFRKGG
jgi:lipopolysaccharide/colanic/teichoic acid biosynthesis glycosyltransferase